MHRGGRDKKLFIFKMASVLPPRSPWAFEIKSLPSFTTHRVILVFVATIVVHIQNTEGHGKSIDFLK